MCPLGRGSSSLLFGTKTFEGIHLNGAGHINQVFMFSKQKLVSVLFLISLFLPITWTKGYAEEYPYTAIFTCGMRGKHINISVCFSNTELEIQNGDDYRLYKIYEIHEAGNEYHDGELSGFRIDLNENFKIKAQNSDDTLVLSINIVKKSSGKSLFKKSVAQYGVIAVANQKSSKNINTPLGAATKVPLAVEGKFANRLGNCSESQNKSFRDPKARKILMANAENIAKLYKFKTSFEFDESLYCDAYISPSILGRPRYHSLSFTPEPKAKKNNRSIDITQMHKNCFIFMIVDTKVKNPENFLNIIWNVKKNKYYKNPGLAGWNQICN